MQSLTFFGNIFYELQINQILRMKRNLHSIDI